MDNFRLKRLKIIKGIKSILAKNDYNVSELFARVTALSYEIKLAEEIEVRAQRQRDLEAARNNENRINKNSKKLPFFRNVIKTVAELKHVKASKVGKVVTQGYMGI